MDGSSVHPQNTASIIGFTIWVLSLSIISVSHPQEQKKEQKNATLFLVEVWLGIYDHVYCIHKKNHTDISSCKDGGECNLHLSGHGHS